MMARPILEVEHLTYCYPTGGEAIHDISMTICENEFVAIIGQNGAGKSTLMKNLTGLLRPTSGRILLEGKDTLNMAVADISKKIGFVLQNPDRQLFSDTVAQEVAYGLVNAGLNGDDIKAKVSEALESVGLEDKREAYPPALSKGDRAKVVIASVIAAGPAVIILDEPTNGQDNRGCSQIMDIARRLHEKGHTIIFVTHNMTMVADYANRAIVMTRREIMMDGTPQQVFSCPAELETTHISPPQAAQLSSVLIGRGLPMPHICLNPTELSHELIRLRGERRECPAV